MPHIDPGETHPIPGVPGNAAAGGDPGGVPPNGFAVSTSCAVEGVEYAPSEPPHPAASCRRACHHGTIPRPSMAADKTLTWKTSLQASPRSTNFPSTPSSTTVNPVNWRPFATPSHLR